MKKFWIFLKSLDFLLLSHRYLLLTTKTQRGTKAEAHWLRSFDVFPIGPGSLALLSSHYNERCATRIKLTTDISDVR